MFPTFHTTTPYSINVSCKWIKGFKTKILFNFNMLYTIDVFTKNNCGSVRHCLLLFFNRTMILSSLNSTTQRKFSLSEINYKFSSKICGLLLYSLESSWIISEKWGTLRGSLGLSAIPLFLFVQPGLRTL
jgi:hypothetical protein